jgi:hypothetical protein
MKPISKSILLISIIIGILNLSSCSGYKVKFKPSGDPAKYKYFRILADADDASVFVKVQDELNIDPKMERYTIIVDIRESNPSPYIQIGDTDETTKFKYAWSKLSKGVQDDLIKWNGSNKENLE